MTLGQNIRTARKTVRITQARLAELVSTTLRTVQRWEADQTEPSIMHLRRISTALGCSIDRLVPEEFPEEEPPRS